MPSLEEQYRSYAERVKSILALFGGICGVSYYFTLLYLSRNRPTFYLDDFQVSSLDKTSNSLTSFTTISFDLRIQNENSNIGIYYDNPLNLKITYFPPTITTNTNVTIEHAIEGFYQGNGKVKHVQASVEVPDLFSRTDRQRRKLGETYVSLAGPAKVESFKVDLDAKIKFKSIENKKSHLMVGSVVEVNGNSGDTVLKKAYQLQYASGSNKWGFVQWLLFLPVFITFLVTFVIAILIWSVLFTLLGSCIAAIT